MDPLAQLKDIHLPEQVHNYPIAPGWWVLIALIIIVTIVLLLKVRKRHKANKAKKQALLQLKSASSAEELVSILKWSALQYFPRKRVAQLSGDAFKAFLIEALPEKHRASFVNALDKNLSQVYQKDHNDAKKSFATFKEAAQLWLSSALPPKKNQANKLHTSGDRT